MHDMIATRILRRARVLIVGCGDVGLRAVPLFKARAAAPRVIALTSHRERVAELRAAGTTPICGDLDDRASLARLAGISTTVLHLAPPQKDGDIDRRTQALIAALSRKAQRRARHGECNSAVSRMASLVSRECKRAAKGPQNSVHCTRRTFSDHADPPRLREHDGRLRGLRRCAHRRDAARAAWNARAKRRVSPRAQLRRAAVRGGWRISIVRIPGIYAGNRLPIARIERGMPALVADEDVFTNHIHADDLAAILVRSLARAKPQRALNASDDTDLPMGDIRPRRRRERHAARASHHAGRSRTGSRTDYAVVHARIAAPHQYAAQARTRLRLALFHRRRFPRR